MPFRLCPPLTANPRMEDLFERAPFRCVAKYYGAKIGSVQVSIPWKDMAAKLGTNFSFHPRKLQKNVCCLIGIEEFRGGKHLSQTFAKCAFTCGNPSSDSDGRHSSEDESSSGFKSGFILHVAEDLSNALQATHTPEKENDNPERVDARK